MVFKYVLETIDLITMLTCIVDKAIIFILKREFMLIGWMIVYILS